MLPRYTCLLYTSSVALSSFDFKKLNSVLTTEFKTISSPVDIDFAIRASRCIKQSVEPRFGKCSFSLEESPFNFEVRVRCLRKQKDNFFRTAYFVARCWVSHYTYMKGIFINRILIKKSDVAQ